MCDLKNFQFSRYIQVCYKKKKSSSDVAIMAEKCKLYAPSIGILHKSYDVNPASF